MRDPIVLVPDHFLSVYLTGRHTDRPTHTNLAVSANTFSVDKSTYRQVQHVVYVAKLCIADRPTGRLADRSTHRQVQHIVYVAKLCIADRLIGRQVDTPTGRHTDRPTRRQAHTP